MQRKEEEENIGGKLVAISGGSGVKKKRTHKDLVGVIGAPETPMAVVSGVPVDWARKGTRTRVLGDGENAADAGELKTLLAKMKNGEITLLQAVRVVKEKITKERTFLLDGYEKYISGEIGLESMTRELEMMSLIAAPERRKEDMDDRVQKAKEHLKVLKSTIDEKYVDLGRALGLEDTAAYVLAKVSKDEMGVTEAAKFLLELKRLLEMK